MKNTSKASIILGSLGLIAGIWAQYQLFEGYESASGKTRALYGIRQLYYLGYLILGCVALLLAFFSMFSKEKPDQLCSAQEFAHTDQVW